MHKLDIIKLSIYTWNKNENKYSLIKLQNISLFLKYVYICYIKLPTNSNYNRLNRSVLCFGINNMFLLIGDDEKETIEWENWHSVSKVREKKIYSLC